MKFLTFVIAVQTHHICINETRESIDRANIAKITKVYCACGVDDKDKEASIPYYENGIYYETKASEKPDESVIVIKTNERTNKNRERK